MLFARAGVEAELFARCSLFVGFSLLVFARSRDRHPIQKHIYLGLQVDKIDFTRCKIAD